MAYRFLQEKDNFPSFTPSRWPTQQPLPPSPLVRGFQVGAEFVGEAERQPQSPHCLPLSLPRPTPRHREAEARPRGFAYKW